MSVYTSEYVRWCPHCDLVYAPDEKIYPEPEKFCPRCGKQLSKDKAEEENE